MADDLFPSEKSGLDVVKITEIQQISTSFHTHSGQDGSPKIDLMNLENKEESQGGKFNHTLYDNSGFNTTSATYVAYTAINKTITQDINEKRYLLLFNAAFRTSLAGTDVRFTFAINGTNLSNDLIIVTDSGGANESHPVSLHYITDKLAQSASGHTFKVMCQTSQGTLYVDAATFSAIELIS